METTIEYLEFTKDEIPVSKKVDIDGTIYAVEIQYNEAGDFYTSVLYDEDDNVIVSSKLVYMGNAFGTGVKGAPNKKLIPLKISDLASDQPEDLRVNAETFGDSIKLYLV